MEPKLTTLKSYNRQIMRGVLFTLFSILSFAGCVWVDPHPKTEFVTVASINSTENCKRIGAVEVNTLSKVAFLERNDDKVSYELVQLARNEAVAIGGNTLVAQAAPVDGRQAFWVFDCPR